MEEVHVKATIEQIISRVTEMVWLSWTAPIVNLCGGVPPLIRGSHK
jgi:hypothetical protein